MLLEVLTKVCQHLELRDLVRVAVSCQLFREGGPHSPIKPPVITVLCTRAFHHSETILTV
jgi:hypothetical protein